MDESSTYLEVELSNTFLTCVNYFVLEGWEQGVFLFLLFPSLLFSTTQSTSYHNCNCICNSQNVSHLCHHINKNTPSSLQTDSRTMSRRYSPRSENKIYYEPIRKTAMESSTALIVTRTGLAILSRIFFAFVSIC